MPVLFQVVMLLETYITPILPIMVLDSYLFYILWGPVSGCYFKRHISAFTGHETTIQLYNSVDDTLPVSERHKIWIKNLRESVSNTSLSEEDRVPTYTSLWRHWLRSSWVHQMWQNSTQGRIGWGGGGGGGGEGFGG